MENGYVHSKNKPIRSKKIRESARGEECTFQGPTCNHNPETTVLCHSNFIQDGKGIGKKSHDIFAFYGCSACHDLYDRRTKYPNYFEDNREDDFYRAMKRTWLRLIDKGIIKIS